MIRICRKKSTLLLTLKLDHVCFFLELVTEMDNISWRTNYSGGLCVITELVAIRAMAIVIVLLSVNATNNYTFQ